MKTNLVATSNATRQLLKTKKCYCPIYRTIKERLSGFGITIGLDCYNGLVALPTLFHNAWKAKMNRMPN